MNCMFIMHSAFVFSAQNIPEYGMQNLIKKILQERVIINIGKMFQIK